MYRKRPNPSQTVPAVRQSYIQILRCVDEGFCVDTVFLDLAKAFDKMPHQRLLEKLRKHGIGGKLLRTIGNW